ncbi:MAG: hypothetical protein K8S54_07605 [Spirochaetia bacterium]|nr:hypothetical protein [Spirochaetia bacterium]
MERDWAQTFRFHVLAFEHVLGENKHIRVPGEKTVYLAGMVARQTDEVYRKQITNMLVNDPSEIDLAVRMHDPYIGQNAPIVTLSRINAEHITIRLAVCERTAFPFETRFPIRLFGLASQYSYLAGNRTMGDIFHFLRNHYSLVLELLRGYLDYVQKNAEAMEEASKFMWDRFGSEKNERNTKKDTWEKQGIDLKRIPQISPSELNGMINFTSKN